MPYVDGSLLPIPKKNLPAYRRMARKAGKIWREYGALAYRECAGDDLGDDRDTKFGISFSKVAKVEPGETVVFAWIVYKSRADRDRVNAKVMKNPRLAKIDPEALLFNPRRMAYGGFKVLVDL